MSSMVLRVEFLPDTSLMDAVDEARAKADTWDLSYVVFDFNGVEVNVLPTRNARVLNAKAVTAAYEKTDVGDMLIV